MQSVSAFSYLKSVPHFSGRTYDITTWEIVNDDQEGKKGDRWTPGKPDMGKKPDQERELDPRWRRYQERLEIVPVTPTPLPEPERPDEEDDFEKPYRPEKPTVH